MSLENGAQLLPEIWIDRLQDRLSLLEDNAPELLMLLPESERNEDRLSVVRRRKGLWRRSLGHVRPRPWRFLLNHGHCDGKPRLRATGQP